MELFTKKDTADLEFVRERRLAFINGLLNDNGMPVPENNDAFLRALKDTEASVMNKAKLVNGQQEAENSAEQNALLERILRSVGGPAVENDDVISITAVEVPMLPSELESQEIVPGEDLDSTTGNRDLVPVEKKEV